LLTRDFSNGFLFAEILSRYYPNDVTLHSFENVISIERKRANWVVLAKLFKVRTDADADTDCRCRCSLQMRTQIHRSRCRHRCRGGLQIAGSVSWQHP
jgi:hypothetical protein